MSLLQEDLHRHKGEEGEVDGQRGGLQGEPPPACDLNYDFNLWEKELNIEYKGTLICFPFDTCTA